MKPLKQQLFTHLLPTILLGILLSGCNNGSGTTPGSSSNTTNTAKLASSTNNGNSTGSQPALLIYASNGAWYGDLGGVSGADAKCQSDPLCPDGATCKAIIGSQGSAEVDIRTACTSAGNCGGINSKNWVLYPEQEYINNNGRILGTVNSNAVFDEPMNTIFDTSSWSGLNTDWTTSGYRCDNWHTGTDNKVDKGIYAIVFAGHSSKGSCSKYDGYWPSVSQPPRCKEEEVDHIDQFCVKRHLYCVQMNTCNMPAVPGVKWSYCDKSNSLLNAANLSKADLIHTNLTKTNLTGANLTRANLSGADLTNADLTNVIFIDGLTDSENKTILDETTIFAYATLDGLSIRQYYLSGANMAYASLIKTDFTDTNLSGANLAGANLNGARLVQANLSKADLTNANLSYSDLTGANLASANLTGADVGGAIWTDGITNCQKFSYPTSICYPS